MAAGDVVRLGISNHNIVHAYLRYTRIPGYKECSSCRNRTKSTCVKCGYCYNCHSVSFAEHSSRQPQRKVLDVYGQETEPICSYRSCRHKFSLHNNTLRCKCRHALNYAAGVALNTGCVT